MSRGGIALASVLPPVLIGFAILVAGSWYIWRHMRKSNSYLTERLVESTERLTETVEVISTLQKLWEID